MPAEILQFPRRDLRTRLGRMLAVRDAVLLSALPARARLLVHVVAFLAHERERLTLDSLAACSAMRPRTVRKYLAVLQQACGEEPVAFIEAVVDHRRPASEWARALENQGIRVAA